MAKNTTPEKPHWRRQAREIADSLAIAFILAMVIRHFVLEVFKIPTKSMEPTLLGDPLYGDKILVNKFAYDFQDPDRWDVIVFKYPENVSRNYIKRVVGLPGETIEIRDGDVFIDGHIARKPWRVQKALWRRRSESGQAEAWRPRDPRVWDLADHRFAANCQGRDGAHYVDYVQAVLAYEERVFRHSRHQFIPYHTNDVMVGFHLVPRRMGGTVLVQLTVRTYRGINDEDPLLGWTVELPVAADRAEPRIFENRRGQHTGVPVASGQPYALEAESPTRVEVANVDRAVIVRVGEREVARHDYELDRQYFRERGFQSHPDISVGCQNAHLEVREPAVYVDVYYTDPPPRRGENGEALTEFRLRPDQFFVLGDNSANSNDSRYWGPVPRSYLVGEAFLVLWPLGRMKIVR
ncbi:MAG: signal peptidase I [Candidatus Brocadiia bacterium]